MYIYITESETSVFIKEILSSMANRKTVLNFAFIFENQNIQFRGGLGIFSTFGRTHAKLCTLPCRHTQLSTLTLVVVTCAVHLT